MERFAFYGTLRRRGGVTGANVPPSAQDRLGIAGAMTSVGPCLIPGILHAVAWYPGLVSGEGEVVGELFDVEAAAVPVLDRFEGFDPGDPERSLFARTPVRLIEPEEIAWVYVWCREVSPATIIPTGDWLEHLASLP